MQFMRIQATIPAKEILRKSQYTHTAKRFLSSVLSALEELVGYKFEVRIPDIFFNFSDSFLDSSKAIRAAHILKKDGVVDFIRKNRRIYSDEPFFFTFRATSGPDTASNGFGADFFSEEKALWKAVGECTERYLWRHYDFFSKDSIVATYHDVGHIALDPFSLAGFSNEQKNKISELYFSEQTQFLWTKATSLIDNKTVLCPAQLVSNMHARDHMKTPYCTKEEKVAREPMLRWCITTGLATGANKEDALTSGLLEVIERDAFMVTYLNKISPQQIDLESLAAQSERISTLLKEFKHYKLETSVLRLPTDFSPFVFCAAIKDTTGIGPAVTIGASADFKPVNAIADALSEALSVRLNIRHQNVADVDMNNIDQTGRLLYWSDYKNLEKLDFLFTGETIKLSPQTPDEDVPMIRHGRAQLKTLIKEFKNKKQQLCYVELSSGATKKAGLTVVKVVAPSMQPMHLHEVIPYLGGDRLSSIPKKLGFKAAKHLNLEPHPFP
jgi:ribosomal protein S12 methylthiotransferase accessory factor